MLQFKNLTITYGELLAIDNASLVVMPGEILALVGPNGAGKTSLINAASGVINAYSGTISINEEKLTDITSQRRARYLAVVPQARLLPLTFTVQQAVLLGRTPYLGWLGIPSHDDLNKVRSALDMVALDHLANRPLGELSGGEQQRVLLARALAQDTPILLLDEPTAHLDIRYQANFMRLIVKLARDKRLAILIALHDLNLASTFADRVALLADGILRAVGAPQEILTSETLSSAYQAHIEVIPHPQGGHPLILLPKAMKTDE